MMKNQNSDLSYQNPFLTFQGNEIQILPFIAFLCHIDSK